MRRGTRARRALAHAHIQWLGYAYAQPASELALRVRAQLKSHQIVFEDDDILITEVGFVTMAIHTNHAVEHDDAIVIPGVDSEGVRGYLVMRENSIPYHSVTGCFSQACHESSCAQQRARALLEAFGDKMTLREAAHRTPWYKLITEQDLEESGLCAWGSDSFLRRLHIRSLAHRYGLPRIFLRLAGPYGDRVVAASLLRAKLDC